MALTPGRWFALSILVGVGLFVYVLPPRPPRGRAGSSSAEAAYSPIYLRASLHYRDAVGRLMLGRTRDSLERVIAEGGVTGDFVAIDPGVTPPARAFLEARLTEERRRLSPPSDDWRGRFYSAAIASAGFGGTDAQRRYGPTGNFAFTGAPLAPGTCVHALLLSQGVIEQLGRGVSPEAALAQPGWRGRDIAYTPCLFFEAYGAPGPAIRTWLVARDFDLALSGERTTAHKPARMSPFESLAFRHTITVCAAGRADRCLRSLLQPASRSRTELRPATWAFPLRSGNLGAEGGHFLADMARDLGPDRFRAFWTSDLSPDSAFAAATGKPLGQWATGWARQTFGAINASPAPGARSTVLAFLITAAAMAWGMWFAARRQV